ncbi:MAG TPA: peptide chain release factor N(5)-glutamine methyltransferase [Steroidobacteraceae bacterium]
MLAALPTIAATRHALADKFRQAGIDSAEADARLLMAYALGVDRAELIANGGRALTVEQAEAIDALAARRLRREPVARIFGHKEFWSLSLQIGPAVLVPRPETETVVEAALDAVARDARPMTQLRILDIGTGSGALLLALLSELANAVGTATDISAAALDVARANAERSGLAGRCTFIACDIAAGVPGPFDLIVSNPPYVVHGEIASLAPEVRDYDPALALDGGADGLDGYRAIAAQARGLLAPGGKLIVELGAGQEAAVRALFTNAGLTVAAVLNDLAGIPRALTATVAP